MAKKNCIVVHWVRDAHGEIAPAFWKGVRTEYVLEFPDAALLTRAEAMKAGRALGADVYSDWGHDSEQALLTLDSDARECREFLAEVSKPVPFEPDRTKSRERYERLLRRADYLYRVSRGEHSVALAKAILVFREKLS